MKMIFYNDEQANKVAEEFFKYHYHDRGIKKWGGFFLSEHTATLRKDHDYINGLDDDKEYKNTSW